MKERPILFNAPMVRALLDGSKTQTRRVVKLPPWVLAGELDQDDDRWPVGMDGDGDWHRLTCPYGQPGDRLWVRETYFAWGRWETRYSEAKGRDEWHFVDLTLECGRQHQFADPLPGALRRRGHGGVEPTWWKRPGILMPKAAARIWLKITGVRVERLQDISRGHAMAEGCPFPNTQQGADPRKWYAELWESINGPDSWDANPWVWVVEFRRLS